MPDLKQLGEFIQAIGFPAAVALILLYQVFAMDKANHASQDKTNETLTHINDKLDQLLRK